MNCSVLLLHSTEFLRLSLFHIFYLGEHGSNTVNTQEGTFVNYRNLKIIIILFQPTGRVFFLSVPKNKKVSLPSALFPKWSGLPQSKLLNMTFSCTTGQLDLHAQLSGTLEVIPRVLSLKNTILSVRVHFGSKVTFKTLILSGVTQFLGKTTSVAVKYDFATRKFLLPPSLMV